MKYPLIVQYVANTLWAIHPEKMAELLGVLAFRAAGGGFSADEDPRAHRRGTPATGPSTTGAVAVIPIHGCIVHRRADDWWGGRPASASAR